MNVLHWHLSRPGNSVKQVYPMRSWSTEFLHQDQTELIAYARGRGIRVVPNLTCRPHTAFQALSRIGSQQAFPIERKFGVFDQALTVREKSLRSSTILEKWRALPDAT